MSDKELSSVDRLWNEFAEHRREDREAFTDLGNKVNSLQIKLAVICALAGSIPHFIADVPWTHLFGK